MKIVPVVWLTVISIKGEFHITGKNRYLCLINDNIMSA